MTKAEAWADTMALAGEQHGVVSRKQANELGVATRRLNRAVDAGELWCPNLGTYSLVAHQPSWRQRLMAVSLIGVTISHRAAAALFHLDGYAEGKLEGTVQRGRFGRRVPDRLTLHTTMHLDGPDRTQIDGIACTSIARTLVDLGHVVSKDQLQAALDSALRAGLITEQALVAYPGLVRPGRSGAGPLVRLLADPARSGQIPDSLFERLVERVITDHGIAAPVLQHEIVLPGGGRRRVDLAWPGHRVAVEAHSKRWHFGVRAEHDDNRRDLELAAAGWEVLYVTWQMAHEPDFFLQHLAGVLDRRTPETVGDTSES